jgi:hypothetical protein
MLIVFLFASEIVSLKILGFNDLSIVNKGPPPRSSRAMGRFVGNSVLVVNIISPVKETLIHFLAKGWYSKAKFSTCVGHQWA